MTALSAPPALAALIRVSRSDMTTDPQRLQIERWAAAQDLGAVEWYAEDGVSGASKSRPIRAALLDACREGRHSTLVVAALDRIGRNAAEVVTILADLRAAGVRVVSLREGIDFQTTVGQMVASVLAFVAQIERESLIARTKAGLDVARRNGVKLGRPRILLSPETLAEARARIKDGELAEDVAPTLTGTLNGEPCAVSVSALRRRLRGV